MSKVWFITGTSRGFGREWAEAALERGDQVAATARDVASLQPLVEQYGDRVEAISLDVRDRSAVASAVAQAHAKFGRLDIVVNNAGYGSFGAIEELGEQQVRDQIDTNLFGALWVTQAALPIFRAQKSGHFLQVSSIGGVMAFQNTGIYHASKWALEALSTSLAAEVEAYGIKVTLIEPAGFTTDWSGSSAFRAEPMPEYDHVRAANAARAKARTPGDPRATRAAVLEIVDSAEPPLRVLFGHGLVPWLRSEYEQRIATWEKWEAVTEASQGNTPGGER